MFRFIGFQRPRDFQDSRFLSRFVSWVIKLKREQEERLQCGRQSRQISGLEPQAQGNKTEAGAQLLVGLFLVILSPGSCLLRDWAQMSPQVTGIRDFHMVPGNPITQPMSSCLVGRACCAFSLAA